MSPVRELRCFIFYSLLLLLLQFNSGSPQTTSPDVSNLLGLKQDIQDGLGYLSDWTPNSHTPCSWTGITCDDEPGRITSLNLSSMNLSGSLNSNIGLFPSLSLLNLSDNSLSGNLPPEIANLTSLTTLDIGLNQFTGSLPGEISRLRRLAFFSAHDNNFTGPMPEELSVLSELQMLDLAGSYFTGRIPSSYSNLTSLTTLKLSGNLLRGEIPQELGRLSELRHLELGYNNYTGGFPAELGGLSKLEYLDLSWTGLSGSIPAEIGALSQCHTVFLYKNRLSGILPEEIGNMSGLMSLDISDNSLSGPIPGSFAQLRRLTLLHLMMNGLNGSLPESLGELEHLETISVWNNFITGSIPSRLGERESVSWIDVSSNLITGEIPRGICSGGSLIKLELFSNALTGTIPNMGNCKRLLRARFHDNRLMGPLPGEFGVSMPNLTRLELSRNRLNGTIPVEICSAPKLAFIDISNNWIHGELPSCIWKIPQLQEIHASGNQLSGGIPDSIATATKMSVLDLSENGLEGGIPSGIASCTRLVSLNLRHNNLSGTIPPSLASLPVLAVLDLSWNSLQGQIPPGLALSRSLEELNISHNSLTGELPSSGVFSSANPSSLEGNPGLCGGSSIAGFIPPCRGSESPVSDSPNPRRTIQWLVAVLFILTFLITGIGLRFLYRRYGWRFLVCVFRPRPSVRDQSEWPWKMTTFQRLGFTVEELLECVREKNIIGKGSTGVVYKAEMASGEVVAIKQLRSTTAATTAATTATSATTTESFWSEVRVLGGIRHRNIVRLLGYCSNHHTDMLVYEYMPNGSLSDILHGRRDMLADWVARYNIAMGVAQGVAYLHHDCFPHVIIHRDVKSSNILLDHNMEARVADFGLAKLIEARESMSVVAGSYGYIAPEYAYTMKVREKGDIYSYGVVLLELLTGKRPVEPEFGEGSTVVEWVHSKLRMGRLVDVLDWGIRGCESVEEEMLLVLRIAMLCTSKSPRDRPSMRDVVSMLLEAKPRRKQIKLLPNCSSYRKDQGPQVKEEEEEEEDEQAEVGEHSV